MIRWIIFALSLGASVTSIIQGVFIFFGLFSMPAESAGINMVSLIMAALPILSAVFALLGGCIAFNESRWGALFLAVATGLCAFAARDVWIFGGLYLLGAILCFFLPKHADYDGYDYVDSEGEDVLGYEEDMDIDIGDDDAVDYEEDNIPKRPVRGRAARLNSRQNLTMTEDFGGFNGGAKVRRRTSKTCPACGATVAIGHRFCPNCGASLHVPEGAEDPSLAQPLEQVSPVSPEPANVSAVSTAILPAVSANVTGGENVVAFKAADQSQSRSISDLELTSVEPRDDRDDPELEVANVKQAPIRAQDLNQDFDQEEQDREEERIQPSPRRVVSGASEDFYNGQAGDNMPEDDYSGYGGPSRISANRKVVRPDREREREPFGAGRIDPDNAYSNFSKYTHRRKKRRRTSLGKRIFGLILLCGAVGGALWFLLNLRKIPETEMPQNDRPKVSLPVADRPNDEPLVQPVAQPEPVAVSSANPDVLPPFTPVTTPRRGLISGSNVNLRENHTTDSRPVGKKMATNTSLELLDTWEGQSKNLTGIWYRVRLGDGREGWVYGKYVQPIGEPLPSGYTNSLLRTYGSDKTSVVNALGQPTRSTATTMEWSGLTVTFRGERVSRLRLTSSQRELRNGLRVGMTQSGLTQLMGFPTSSKQRQVQYNEGGTTGITIQLDANNAIQNITVNEVGS